MRVRPFQPLAALLATAMTAVLLLTAAQALPLSEEGDSGKWITGKEALAALMANRTHYRDRSDGTSEIEFHSTDGRSAYLWDNCIERGNWWTTEQQVCFYYPDTTLQGPHCFWIKENAESQLEFWWAGDPAAPLPTATNIKDVEGNVERLPLDVTGECVMS